MYKTKLQELCQRMSWSLPEYETNSEGPDHKPRFSSTVTVNAIPFRSSSPTRSAKQAQNAAAMLAFHHFSQPIPIPTPIPDPIPDPSIPNLSSFSQPSLCGAPSTSSSSPPGSPGPSPDVDNIIPTNSVLQPKVEAACQTSQISSPVTTARDITKAQDQRNMIHLYKNQLQSYAQKRNLNLPEYSSESEGPPHCMHFKCKVTIDGQTYESPKFYSTLKDAEHSAAEVALMSLSPSGVQEDDTGLYKNLLQELVQKEGFHLPGYSTNKSGEAHIPIFVSQVEVQGKLFTGQEAKSKKQAEMSAAKVAYTALKERKGKSSPPLRSHEVFLSFRGEDTRASFTSHLHASLQNAGIAVFRDDDSIERGDYITSLFQAIEHSRISVIVFSRNYADSRWCLDELEKIMKCHRTIGQVVLPVFYDVNPSEVRHQTGQFGDSFQNLLNRISKQKEDARLLEDGNDSLNLELSWREVLREVAGLAGFVVLNSRNESEAVKHIVEKVTHLLDKIDLFVADNPVGVESRVQDMIQLLDIQQSKNVLLLGMWGMGGIGKTTIAKAIYNKIGRNFEGRSFLANIREDWEQTTKQVCLQEQLLFDIFKETTTNISSIDSGKSILKDRLCHKRVLLVLDDVDKLDQLKALCGSREWFGSGSRIIITTRDFDLLKGIGVDDIYIMKEMDESESIELFSWHAFNQARPIEDFVEISRNVIEYSGKLPLALEVLGSHLFDKGLREWKCILEKLKKIPNHKVQKKLKISYDGLNYDTEKEIFLDIACFFIGMDRNDVIHILNGCGLFAEIGISVLVKRSLVTVDDNNKLGMHDLLRDMGREIIREKSPKDLEKRSRLCFHEDVLDVLSEQTGTSDVEGLALKLPRANAKCFSTKAFENMKKLRLLQLAGVQLDGNFQYLSKNLRWLCWNGFPLPCIPANFSQGNLVSIELENSNVKLVWEKTQRMEKLKILNLSHSHYLTQTPDFSNLPNLEKLILTDCPKLSQVSHSIEHLSKVLLINLEDCVSLRNLPRSIYKLKSLKTLILSGCLMIDKLEEDLEQMKSLTTLIANNTAITRVPFSVVRSKSIGYISLCGYEGFSHDMFPSIIWSWMSPTNNLPSPFQPSNAMSFLVSLYVPNSSFHELSSISKYLPGLRSLWVECGSEFQLSQVAARILDALHAPISKELESTATTSQVSNMKASSLIQRRSQVHISGSKNFMKSLLIQMGMNCQVTNILKENILQNMTVNGYGDCLLPGDSYPDWLTFNCEGSSVTFEVPQVEGCNLKTMMCIIHSSTPNNITSDGLKNVLVINHTKATIQLYNRETLASFENEEGQRVVSNIEPGNKVEVVVVFGNSFTVKKTTVYLIYEEPIGEKMG